MSQEALTQQTYENPLATLPETAATHQQTLGQRINSIGSAVMDYLHNGLETSRRKLPVAALAGGLVLSGAYEGSLAAEAAPAADSQAATVSHHHSTMTTQKVLDKIHDALGSGDSPAAPHYKIHPTKANLHSSAGAFYTNCPNNRQTYRYFIISQAKSKWAQCELFNATKAHRFATENEFRKPLNTIGRHIRLSVDVSAHQSTKAVKGNRKEVVASYRCPDSSEFYAVKEIILDRKADGSRATITTC